MSKSTILIEQVRRRLRADQTDAQLLDAFVDKNDQSAFTSLVERYGPLVWSVCRRQLNDDHAADDATQATFLALMKQASRIRPPALAAWLACVARRVARKARAAESRRQRREATARTRISKASPADDLSMREVMTILDEEILRLPVRYRSALLACYWQGLTQAEAARRQGITQSALKGLLERGRNKLLARLRRRGLTADVALHGLLVAPLVAVFNPSASRASAAALFDRPISPGVAVLIPQFGLGRGAMAALAAVVVATGLIALPGALLQNQAKDPPPAKAENKQAAHVDLLGDPLPDGALLRLGSARFKHPGNGEEIALSPDGKIVAAMGGLVLFAWDAHSGKQLWKKNYTFNEVITGSIAAMKYLAFQPDSKRLITAATRNSFAIVDAANGQSQTVALNGTGAPPAAGPPNVRSVDIAPDGKALAVGTTEGVFLCNFDGVIRRKFPCLGGGPHSKNDRLVSYASDGSLGQFSPDGKTLAVTDCSSKLLRLYEPNSGSERLRIELSAYLVRMAFSPDSKMIAVTERDNAVRVYDVASGKRLHSWIIQLHNPLENYTSAVTFSPDGKRIAVCATDNLIYLFDPASGKEAGRLKGTDWYPWGLAFTSNGKTLFSTGWDGEIRRWDVAERKQVALPNGAIRGSEVVAASPDGKKLAYADGEGGVRVVDAHGAKEIKRFASPIESISRLAFSRDSRFLAVGGGHADRVAVATFDLAADKPLRKWDWEKGRDPYSAVDDMVFSPNNKQLAVAVLRRDEFRILDLAGENQRRLAHQSISGLDYSPDGVTLATAGWDKTLRLWNPATGELLAQTAVDVSQVPDPRMLGARYSPDGKLIATPVMTGVVFMWDGKTLAVKNRIQLDYDMVHNAFAFSPDGLRLATGDRAGRIRLWDPKTGAKLWGGGRQGRYINALSFGRDSRTVLAGGNGVGYVWDLQPKELPKKDIAALWNDLTGSDAVAAEQAFWTLVNRPAETVALFSERVQPRRKDAVDIERAKKLIAELGDSKFSKREAALNELAKFGPSLIPHLKKSLAETESVESRSRLTQLIDRLTDSETTVIKNRRLVSVLWHAGTPAAKQLLEHWANTAGDSLGELASAALKNNVP